MKMFIENKVAIVTGGAGGIGLCCAVELLKNNLKGVTLADVDPVKGQEAVDQITKEFGANKVIFVTTDVTSQKQVENAFNKTVEKFGNLDIVVNNAGIMFESIWEKEIAINLNGTIHGCLLAMEEYIPKYKSDNEGVIVNMASVAGIIATPHMPMYSATKHGIVGLTRSLGTPDQYETTNVRVVAICPGATETTLLENGKGRMLNQRYEEILKKNSLESFVFQGPDAVAKCLVKVVEEGPNGSIWVSEGNEMYEVDIPERQQMKKK